MSSVDASAHPVAAATRVPGRVLYRVRQGLNALRPSLDPAAMTRAQAALLPGERRLFAAMEKRDQRHALEVFGRLRARGATDRDLMAAALLHDCGKGLIPVWLRTLNVLAPPFVAALAREEGTGARGAAYRLLHHPGLGADLARSAGSSATTVRYIGGRADPEEEANMEQLKAADGES
jgi:hypothetical protein